MPYVPQRVIFNSERITPKRRDASQGLGCEVSLGWGLSALDNDAMDVPSSRFSEDGSSALACRRQRPPLLQLVRSAFLRPLLDVCPVRTLGRLRCVESGTNPFGKEEGGREMGAHTSVLRR